MRTHLTLAAAAALALSGAGMAVAAAADPARDDPPEPVDPEIENKPRRRPVAEYQVTAETGQQRVHARTREMERYASQQARIAEKRRKRAAKEAQNGESQD